MEARRTNRFPQHHKGILALRGRGNGGKTGRRVGDNGPYKAVGCGKLLHIIQTRDKQICTPNLAPENEIIERPILIREMSAKGKWAQHTTRLCQKLTAA